jgi:pantoate--beta-alanine ligase
MAEGAGVDILFAPSQGEMYPDPAMTVVSVPEVGKRWEGEHRPGHFEGVATVVAKLFNIVEPDIAFFGRKDFQQCAVIKRLVKDLNFRLEISIEPTVRESDGLAMSSRNRYLSESDRKVAPTIFHTLKQCRTKMLKGLEVAEALESGKSELADAGFSVDYIAYVDDASLEPLKQLRQDSTLICAARLKATRLIDNISVI